MGTFGALSHRHIRGSRVNSRGEIFGGWVKSSSALEMLARHKNQHADPQKLYQYDVRPTI